ncbi:MAG: TonB-dependent receptor, partial [Pseudomonadota bacterium]|nr:TonB-dependent receptor [Pseudomonadota bacterium]
MNTFKPSMITLLVATSFSATAEDAISPEENLTELEAIEITSQQTKSERYIKQENNTSAVFGMTNRETPQAMTSVTHAQIEDFELSTVDEVLSFSNGVVLEQVEPGRYYARARGFLVDQMATDGVGFPSIHDNFYGFADAAVYDSVEILRGANGMMNGTGNPSATINLIRKRPTEKNEGKVKFTMDHFGGYRGDVDLSNALNESGTVKGRLVLAHSDGDTYIDDYQPQSNVVYGVISYDITNDTKLTVGNEYDFQDIQGIMWGALPLVDNLGNPVSYDVGQSSAAKWSTAQNRRNNFFANLETSAGNWDFDLSYDHLYSDLNAEWIYNYNSGNPESPYELYSFPSRYDFESTSSILDARASTYFSLFDQFHEFGLGLQYAQNDTNDGSTYTSESLPPIENIKTWDNQPPKPSFDTPADGSDVDREQTSAYFTAKLNFTDQLSLLAGGRYAQYEASGLAYGNDWDNDYDKFTPAIGLSYEITQSNTTLYSSYNQIFKPQNKQDEMGVTLNPVEGETYEIGIKQGINADQLLVALALFHTEQTNVPVAVGMREDFTTIYAAQDELTSQGIELDISGEITKAITVNGGFSHVQIEDKDGKTAKTAFPENSFTLSVNYNPAALPELRVGANTRWQDDIFAYSGDIR